ncbi:MAG: hypothetical protein QF689_04170, partial [Candidatus Latescibacteria bacterium]|nr:hypothetical protein [Candidatus Latescibacterota bacterium]
YEFDRPHHDHLQKTAVYRLFFPNRKADRKTAIVGDSATELSLVIEGFGDVAERRMTWSLPLVYPEVATRRLVPDATDLPQ